ncbi:hypothetical protein C0993_004330, partial [Termitomyces sp. T159_Od127]
HYVVQARPVYLTLPTDLVSAKISSQRLRQPLTRNPPVEDPRLQSFVLDLVYKHFQEAEGDAVVLVDACAIRQNVKNELDEFLKIGFPVFTTPMGKTAVDENFERYGGVSNGAVYILRVVFAYSHAFRSTSGLSVAPRSRKKSNLPKSFFISVH